MGRIAIAFRPVAGRTYRDQLGDLETIRELLTPGLVQVFAPDFQASANGTMWSMSMDEEVVM